MADHTIREPKEFTDAIRKFEVTDRGHADVFNGPIEKLANNDAYLKEKLDAEKQQGEAHRADTGIHVTAAERTAWDGKAENKLATASADGLFAKEEKAKLGGIQAGAEVNQNAFSAVKAGGNVIQANGKKAQAEIAAGANISVSGDNASKRITVSVNTAGLDADTLDGKHAKTTLATTEKGDLAAAINELKAGKQDKMTVDSALSSASTNPVQNKAVNAALAGKAAASHTHNYAGSASAGGAAATALSCSGNAATATAAGKLQTARTINGTAFNGTGNITTANWGTARSMTVGNKAKSVNGGADVAWSLAEIGAAPASHTHSYAGSASAGGAAKGL